MSPFSRIQKELDEIHQSRDFQRLNCFKDPLCWQNLSKPERERLATLFIFAGKAELEEMRLEAFKHFKWAEEIASDNRDLLLLIVEAHLHQKDNIGCIKSAYQLIERLLHQYPEDVEIRLIQAKTITYLGIATEEPILIQSAHALYEEMTQLTAVQNHAPTYLAALWGHANALEALARLSEEANDLHQALLLYRQAQALRSQNINFWIDYSNCLWRLSQLVGDSNEKLMEEGLQCCDSLLNAGGDHPIGFYHMARWWQALYESTWRQDAFERAQIYFEAVVSINMQLPEFWIDHGSAFWFDWGRFLTSAGKWNRDFSLLEKASNKFEQAHLMSHDQPLILNGWAEVLILVGSEGEHYELLREAEQKLAKSIELQRDIPETWILHGMCLYELGQYFSDERYFTGAREKVLFALQLKPEHPDALHVLALVQYMLGELWSDPVLLEKSHDAFTAALQHGAAVFPQFWNDWGICCLKLGELSLNRQYVEFAVEKFEHCIERYKQTSEGPVFSEWLYHYGCALDFLGDLSGDVSHYEKAVDVLQHTLEQSKDCSYISFSLALAYAHLGEAAEDYECFCKSCELFEIVSLEEPEDEHLWNEWGVALINLAELVYDPVHPEKAQELFLLAETKLQRAVMLGSQSALYHLACCYSLCGNVTEAMEYMERAEHYNVLPPLQDLVHDDWLELLRKTPQFQQFLNTLALKKRDADQ